MVGSDTHLSQAARAARATFHSFNVNFSFIIIKAIRPSRIPKLCTLCSSHRIELFPAKIERFPGPPPPPPGPPSLCSKYYVQPSLWVRQAGPISENPVLAGESWPRTLGAPQHKLSMQSCSVRSRFRSCIYSELGGSFGARTLTGMAGLTHSQVYCLHS